MGSRTVFRSSVRQEAVRCCTRSVWRPDGLRLPDEFTSRLPSLLPRYGLCLLECGFLLCVNRVIHVSMDSNVRGAAAWRKSRHSMSNGNCAEAAVDLNGVMVRDSANPEGVILGYAAQVWRVFLMRAKTGEFDVKIE